MKTRSSLRYSSEMPRRCKYNLRNLPPVNYAESPIPRLPHEKSSRTVERRQRSKSSDSLTTKQIQMKRCASLPPTNVLMRGSPFLYDEICSEEEFEISVHMRRRATEATRQSRSHSPKDNPNVERRGRKKSISNYNVSNSVERELNYADSISTPSYGRVEKKTVSSGETRNVHLNISFPISGSETSPECHEPYYPKQSKERRKSTYDNQPQTDNPRDDENLISEPQKGGNEYLPPSPQKHAKAKSKGRSKSIGGENYQGSSQQHLPPVQSVISETSKGTNRDHSSRNNIEKQTSTRRNSTGHKTFQESTCDLNAPKDDLKAREMKYTLCEKRLEAMYREDPRKKVSPKNTENSGQMKVSVPFEKIFSRNGNDNQDLMKILSDGNDVNMAHFKKKLIQRSVPTEQNSIQESQEPAEEPAQSSLGSLSPEVPQRPISTPSERAESVRISSTSLDETRRTSLPLPALETSPGSASTNATPVSPSSPVSPREPEKRQGVKRQLTASAPNLTALEHSSERNAVSSLSSEPKQPTTSILRQRSSYPVTNSDPNPVRRPRSNSAKLQNQLNTDKTPPFDPSHQDDFFAARNMNCTITRLEAPNSIPVNIQIGKTSDLETTKTLLVLVDSIMRNNELSVENLMALNKFYRDLKNYLFNNNPDEGLRRDIEDRTKNIVGFVAKHLIGTQCNISYIERMLFLDLQPHEQFFRRYIREIKHYARDQQSMETLIRNLSNSEEIVLQPRSTEVPAKVVRFDVRQDHTTHSPRQVDPKAVRARPPALRYSQLQETRPRLPFNEIPRGNFQMINAPQMPYFNHNQQGQNGVYPNQPMYTVPPPTAAPPMNNNPNWRGPVRMMCPPIYTLSKMLVPPNTKSTITFVPNRFDTPGSQSKSSGSMALPVTMPLNITELRDSNATTSNRFSSPSSGNRERFNAASYDINMNNTAYPNSFNTLDPINKAAFMTVMNDSRNMVRSTPPSAPINVSNPNATLSGHYVRSSELGRNIVRLMSSVDNAEANNPNPTVSTSFVHENQHNRSTLMPSPNAETRHPVVPRVRSDLRSNSVVRLLSSVDNAEANKPNSAVSTSFVHENQHNGSTLMPSPNTETRYPEVPRVRSGLRSNSVEVDNLNNVSCSKKSYTDSNAATIVYQNGGNSVNRSSTPQNDTLVKNPRTPENEAASRSPKKDEMMPAINHPITVEDQNMTVILTRNSVKEQVENRDDSLSVKKLENVKHENDDSKDNVRVWYYAQQLKRWKKMVKDTNPIMYQQILKTCEHDSSVIIVDDNDKEDDNDVCFVAQYFTESSNNIVARAKESSFREIKEEIHDEEITTVARRENSSSLQLRSNTGIVNQTVRDNFHSPVITESNTQLAPSANFRTYASSNGTTETRNSGSYYIQRISSEETIRDTSSNFQLRNAQIVKRNSREMLRSSNANEPIRAELQTDIGGEIVNGYSSQFQTSENNADNTSNRVHFQLERASDNTSDLQGMNWRFWMSHEGQRRISNIHETPTVASRNYSSDDKWFQVVGHTVSKRERVIKMVQSKLVYDEVNHSLVSLMEDANGNERRIETFLPRNVFLSGDDSLSDPELYIKEYGIVANYAPLGYLEYYRFVTGYQIVRDKPPVSFLTFIQLNNAGHLRQLLTKFLNFLEKNGDGNFFSSV